MSNLVKKDPSKRQILFNRLKEKLETAYHLNRKVVSFQSSKGEPIYRWFKYKEGFSSTLVQYFLNQYGPKKKGKVLDPFAGAGTTLFAGQELGWESYGIELLPVGTFVMGTRDAINHLDIKKLTTISKKLWSEIAKITNYTQQINHIKITQDAFPEDTEVSLNKYLFYVSTIKNKNIQMILRFAAFTVLEQISYTRKDGQYLRWDHRSKRNLKGKPFSKGEILTFDEAVKNKLDQITKDLSQDSQELLLKNHEQNPVNIIEGSCLEKLPALQSNFFDFTITSPPYCNRYDYTRTYALELVYLGYDHEQVVNLRQSMLSCTVENKEKIDHLKKFYSSIGQLETFEKIIKVYNNSDAMMEVNSVLEELVNLEKLNNKSIARMVKNYFLELCFVIYEMARVTKKNGYCVMVNDNVRYGGEEIPVDLILSEFAESFGFNINKIFVLPRGKGNSSQQMGIYGRTEVRKCVYLWQKK